MKVVVLCPGPSLNRFLSAGVRESDCIYIGVNRAAAAWPCHYFSFGDLAAFHQVRPMPLPDRRKIILFTARTHWQELGQDDAVTMEYEPLSYETVAAHVPEEIAYRNYTTLASLVLAEWLLRGEPDKRVRVYGADMSGLNYYDGSPCTGGGEESYRWSNEAHHFTCMAAWLMGRGVIVERIGAEEKAE